MLPAGAAGAGAAVEGVKRFWKTAGVEAADGGFAVALDGRQVRTPCGRRLALPNRPLAEAVAAEWDAVEAEVRPHAMPLTGFANAAIDLVADDAPGFADGLARYGASDMLCYRADAPEPLVARQAAAWDPLLDWARARFGVAFVVTAGIVPVSQPPETRARLGAALAAHPPFALAALSPLVTLSGSLVLALALAERAIDEEAAWTAALLDETFQAERWGEDAEAVAIRADRRRQFRAAARFLDLALSG
jgi:chaperone required for assembly of F1-ATPase